MWPSRSRPPQPLVEDRQTQEGAGHNDHLVLCGVGIRGATDGVMGGGVGRKAAGETVEGEIRLIVVV